MSNGAINRGFQGGRPRELPQAETYSLFRDDALLVEGALMDVLRRAKACVDSNPQALPLIFHHLTGEQVDFDLRGDLDEVLGRVRSQRASHQSGVQVEIRLLSRHWEWLRLQPSSASAVIRALIEAEMEDAPALQAAYLARDATYRVMVALAGDRVGFEEAARALYRNDVRKFRTQIVTWPDDIRQHLLRLAEPWFLIRQAFDCW